MGSPRVLKVADQIKVIVAEMLERRIKDPPSASSRSPTSG